MAKAQPERPATPAAAGGGFVDRALNAIETVGNRLPDPAILFLLLLVLTWIASAILAPVEFTEIDPRNDEPLRIANPVDGHRPRHVPRAVGAHLHRFRAARRGAGGPARGRSGRENRLHQRRPKADPGPHVGEPADPDAHPGRHRQPHRGRRRLRARHPPGRGHLLRGGPAPPGRHLGRLRGRLGRVLGQLHPLGHRPPAAGVHPAGGADPRRRADGQPAEQPRVHRPFVAARHRRRLVPDRPRHRAAPAVHGRRRRPRRDAEDGRADRR